ncbi:phosphotransferase family protein [Brevibacterium album]|uniref:phosphotransferase family protein n=1 Tax=Brevibacterium album TaxID=417948 RepID=UPI00040C1EDC|nr:phosphotransferase family protein [Brevibacterium album]
MGAGETAATGRGTGEAVAAADGDAEATAGGSAGPTAADARGAQTAGDAEAAAAHARAAGLDTAALEGWLRGRLGDGAIRDPQFLTGGTQNVLLGFTWEPAAAPGRRLIYRGPPVNKRENSDAVMLREARVLAALAGSDVPHPAFVAACEDLDVLGNAFFVMEAVDGFNGVSEVPASVAQDEAWQHAMGLSHARAVAALGNVDPFAVGLEGFGKPAGWLARQPGRWTGQLESYRSFESWPGLDHPGTETIPRWLAERLPETERAGIIHGDCHAGNVLFSREEPAVAALVDWELSTLGDPLLDLGHLLASRDGLTLPGAPTNAEVVEAYAGASRHDTGDVDYFHVLACFRFGAILEGSQARASAGLVPESVGRRLHERTVSLFDQAMRVIDGEGVGG